ncbi:MAG TPA: hypothetical protein VMM54_02690 [Nitrospirota bacterium]|nr:hypothetical protein [Nitrospirota bacterium]
MSRIKDKLLNMLFYFLVLSIVAFILGFASLGGYLFGSVQTAKEYDFIFKSFKDNVEARQVFYFCGYRVVPKGNGVTINLSAQERADLSEAKEAALRTMINEDFSKRDVDFRHKILQSRLVLK